MAGSETRQQEQRSKLFGSYKAEWLRERVFELFAEPAYFPELTTNSPCVLMGGRGTGKTTALRCMSYKGQYALHGNDSSSIPEWNYYGMYYRVNTNRVTAFMGPEIDQQRWQKTFGHYLNLVLCDLAVKFLEWYQAHGPKKTELNKVQCTLISESLQIDAAVNISSLSENIRLAKLRFESYINNIAEAPQIELSMQGAPVDELFSQLRKLEEFSDKQFFFLLDEYENFKDYQQQIVNTLIKHSGDLYSFKVSVRELGWRVRTTLNENEQLVSPSDYVRIDISEKLNGDKFEAFAWEVSNERIRRMSTQENHICDVRTLLKTLTEDQEAQLLDGGFGVVAKATSRLQEVVPTIEQDKLDNLSRLEKYYLVSRADAEGHSVEDEWSSFVTNRVAWRHRFTNYTHSLLYTIRSGKRGIRKHYCGARVFSQMAAGNIRYFLELVDQSIAAHLDKQCSLGEPIDPIVQTGAAQRVGKKNLSELEGLSVDGAKLTKLVLGLGRVLQVMASKPFGHTPEVTQFYITKLSDKLSEETSGLLTSAVMHLALLRSPGNKLMDRADIAEYDYMLHPIFSAFFVYSYRRKRKLSLQDSQLLSLVTNHKKAIRGILASQNRDDDELLPDQLQLFGPYYDVTTQPTDSD